MQVLGLDSSPELLAIAKQRGVETLLLDAHDLASAAPRLGKFDAVLSNAAMHWMVDLPKVLAGIYTVLQPGGRLIAEMGGKGNVASIFGPLQTALGPRGLDMDALNPWTFPSAEEVCWSCATPR